jgi:transposase
MYKILPDRYQTYLFPYKLDDFVKDDSPVRFIDSYIDSLELKSLGLIDSKSGELGRPGYGKEMLLKLWLYGYYKKIISSRELEEACRSDVNFIWLTGCHKPDHNTIWRYFKKYKKKLKGIFKQSVKLSLEAGMVDFVLNATDGTKIKADVCKEKSLHRRDLKLIEEELSKQVDNYIKEVEKTNKEHPRKVMRLPNYLKDESERKDWIEKKLKELNEEEKNQLNEQVKEKLGKLDKKDTNHLSEIDEDSRMMKCDGKTEMAYNGQIVVDSKEQIILACDVINDEADNHQLVKNIDEVQINTDRVGEETLGDRGYFSGEELNKANEKNYNVLVRIDKKTVDGQHSRESKFHKSNFVYDEKEDCYYCFNKGKLTYAGIKKERGYCSKTYQCKDFKTCPYRKECSKNKKGRLIIISPYLDDIEKQLDKQKLSTNKDFLKKRMIIVEPVFGIIKHVMGFRRWTLRGLENVKAQWAMLCSVYNLKKLYKNWLSGKILLAC